MFVTCLKGTSIYYLAIANCKILPIAIIVILVRKIMSLVRVKDKTQSHILIIPKSIHFLTLYVSTVSVEE